MTITEPSNLLSLHPASSPMTTRDAAKEILWHRNDGLSWKACQFLGQVVGLPERPLSDAQQVWLEQLIARAGLSEGVSA